MAYRGLHRQRRWAGCAFERGVHACAVASGVATIPVTSTGLNTARQGRCSLIGCAQARQQRIACDLHLCAECGGRTILLTQQIGMLVLLWEVCAPCFDTARDTAIAALGPAEAKARA